MQKKDLRQEIEWYSSRASQYAKSDSKLFGDRIVCETALKTLFRERKGYVLDLACGTGRYSSSFDSKRWIGLDLNRSMLNYARNKGAEGLVCGDMFRLPFKDNSFGGISCIGTIAERVPLAKRLISEMVRVVSPGGFIFFTVVPTYFRLKNEGILLYYRKFWYAWSKFFPVPNRFKSATRSVHYISEKELRRFLEKYDFIIQKPEMKFEHFFVTLKVKK